MSGPKDFTITYSNAPAAEIRRHNEAFRRVREAHVRQKLIRAQQAFALELSQQTVADKARIGADLSRRAEERQKALNAAQSATHHSQAATPSTSNDGKDESSSIAANAGQNKSRSSETSPLAAGVQSEASPTTHMAVLQSWSEVLAEDESVSTFGSTDRTRWEDLVHQLRQSPANDLAGQSAALAAEAEAIHKRSGEAQLQFDARNQLLKDVIESMKEIGYFVSDPYFANPGDPGGAVILKATCGSQVVTTTIDLSSMVKSVWDGQELEGCKDAFFEYMDAMKSRGVEMTPDRDDLRERPKLKQNSANELPRSNGADKHAGG